MFCREPEGCYQHRLCSLIAPFWLSMEYHSILIMPVSLSTDHIYKFISYYFQQLYKILNICFLNYIIFHNADINLSLEVVNLTSILWLLTLSFKVWLKSDFLSQYIFPYPYSTITFNVQKNGRLIHKWSKSPYRPSLPTSPPPPPPPPMLKNPGYASVHALWMSMTMDFTSGRDVIIVP